MSLTSALVTGISKQNRGFVRAMKIDSFNCKGGNVFAPQQLYAAQVDELIANCITAKILPGCCLSTQFQQDHAWRRYRLSAMLTCI